MKRKSVTFVDDCITHGIDPDSPTAEAELEEAIESDVKGW